MRKLFLLVAILTCSWNLSVSAKTWRVSNVDATANYAALDAALQGITAGDTLSLAGFPSGLYFINVSSENVNKTIRIIKRTL